MDDCIADRIAGDDALAAAVDSVVRYGSYERGDFVPGESDLDFFLVLDAGAAEDGVVGDVESILRDCAADVPVREVDVAWEYRGNLADPLNEGRPWKFLTVYQQDFRQHHTVVYGTDVADTLPPYDFDELVEWRAGRLRELADEAHKEGDRKLLHVAAGEVTRLRALVDGADSLRKDDVLAALAASDREAAHRVYEHYVESGSYDLDPELLVSFVREQTAELTD